ncbi:hypothetical protein [Massilia sp. DWR3-1-1]|uniref:hypothetical protein n=1 Tax=Massilia sp. DWR3-1-1 TaxID=2804559 RepID=UPI003CEC20CF
MKSSLSVAIAACMTMVCAAPATAAETGEQFMATLQSMCGQRFEGALSYAIDPRNPYVGQKMSTDIVCTGKDVRLPVTVGEDRSRTWIFSRTAAGLDLRHDHRHPDGTPEPVTMYGGLAKDGGTALSQSFLADAITFKLFPGSETNIWTVSVSADGSVLTYHLDRHARPRIEFVMKRVAH